MEAITRNQARGMFVAAGLTYEKVTREMVQHLRTLIDDQMIKSGYMDGTFRCHRRVSFQFDDPRRRWAAIRCQSFYFKNREVVSFNRDGFIGFAGWADEKHIKPILEGFVRWVKQSG